MTGPRSPRLAAALLVLAAATACSGDPNPPGQDSPSASGASSHSPSPSASPSSIDSGATPTGRPTPVTPDTDLLDWSTVPVAGPDDTVTAGSGWLLLVEPPGLRATLNGGGADTVIVQAGRGRRITDSFLTDEYAVVVAQDRREQRPSVATVVVLESGTHLVIDGRSDVPTTTGGTWALGSQGDAAVLLHATVGKGRTYCLAEVALPGGTGRRVWCAPPRHGFTDARVTPWGTTLLTFDDSRPSCRTVVTLVDDRPEAIPGVPDCRGWDGLVLDGSRVWSVVRNERRVEASRVYASVGDVVYDLGPAITGSLTECAGAAYFARDPATSGEPGRLLRWTPEGRLSVVYESPVRREAAVSAPRCGGDSLTVTSLNDERDELVVAPVR